MSSNSEMSSGEDLLAKLRSALLSDGDFPASAKVVNKLKEMTNDPRTTAQQVAEIILREPSLSTRVLHLVNSSFYRRAKPIMTVSQAVVAVGMKSIADLCAGLVLLQRFVPMARKGGPFAECFKKSVVTSLLASSYSAEIGGTSEGTSNELGYISGFFSELGTLLLAYYFPKVYEAAAKRAQQKEISIAQSLRQLTGLSTTQLSAEVIRALNLPPFYLEALTAAEDNERLRQTHVRSIEEEKILVAGKAVAAGYCVSSAISSGDSKELAKALNEVNDYFDVGTQVTARVLARLDTLFKEHCSTTELELPPLPSFIEQFAAQPEQASTQAVANEGEPDNRGELEAHYLEEIKQAIENREPTASIITSCMEALKFALGFERVILFLFDSSKRKLAGRMALGADSLNPTQIVREVDERSSRPEAVAIREQRPVFEGDAIVKGGWPFAILPIGITRKCLGVIYADRVNGPKDLDERARAFVNLLTTLLERSITQSKS